MFKTTDFIFSAFDDSKSLVEAIELKGHPFFIGIQAHPEFLSRPLRPHPLFRAFLKAIGNISE
jgi:CTP synthase